MADMTGDGWETHFALRFQELITEFHTRSPQENTEIVGVCDVTFR